MNATILVHGRQMAASTTSNGVWSPRWRLSRPSPLRASCAVGRTRCSPTGMAARCSRPRRWGRCSMVSTMAMLRSENCCGTATLASVRSMVSTARCWFSTASAISCVGTAAHGRRSGPTHPLAVVTWFAADRRFDVSAPVDRAELKARIDESLPSTNLIVAVRITGDFGVMRTRTVTEQHRPSRPFTEATEDQQELTFTDVTGTLAGFRMPDYQQGIPVAVITPISSMPAPPRRACPRLPVEPGRRADRCPVRVHSEPSRTPEFFAAELNKDDLDTQIRHTEGE